MANNLPLIGVDAQVLNSREYFRTLGEIQTVTNKVSKSLVNNATVIDRANKTVERSTRAVTKSTEFLGKNTKELSLGSKLVKDLTKNLDGLINSLLMSVGIGGNFGATIAQIVSGIVSAAAPIALLVAGITALVMVITTLGQRSAEIEGVRNAFYALNAQFGMMADDTLVKLRAGSNGLINDFQLMQTVNRALAGSTDALGQAYLQNIDKLMAIAQVQARATGQSVEYLFDSLIRGIKRGSPLIIDNTYLIVSEAEAHQVYADKIGVVVAALSEEQKQIALLEATVEAGTRAIEAAGGIQITTAIKIQQMGTLLQNTFDRAALAIKPLFDLIVDGAQYVLNTIIPVINVVIDVIGFLVKHTVESVRRSFEMFGKLIQPALTLINNFITYLTNNGEALATGAGRMMAAYADGLLWGLNTFVLPAVLQIAQAIANFLVGQSPPPEGPLSEIFEGGAAVMDAWTKGFLGASLQPVETVALKVSNLMGGIATMSLQQVTAQLARIDSFLKPFENRVALLEARFKSLDEVVQGAFNSIDKQQEKLLEQLNKGDAAAADKIRALDVERDKWQDILDTQGAVVDDAKYQLALARATTIAQKSALEIQKAKLESQQQLTKEIEKGVTPVEKAVKGAEEKKAEPVSAEEPFGGLAIPPTAPADSSSWLDNLAAAFGEGFRDASTQLGTTEDLLGQINAEFNRITPEGITSKFTGFLEPVASSFETSLFLPIQGIIDKITFLFTGEGAAEGPSLPSTIQSFVFGIPGFFTNLPTQIAAAFLNPWSEAGTTVSDMLTAVTLPGSFAASLFNLPTNISTWLVTLRDTLLQDFITPFDLASTDIFDILFNRELSTSLASSFFEFFAGTGTGTLTDILAIATNLFTNFPASVAGALGSMGLVVWNSLVLPIINGLNVIIDNINTFIQNNETLGTLIAAALGVTGLAFGDLVISKLNTSPPAILTGARPQASGGLTRGPGAVKVNEKGQEGFVLGPATQMMTFPNEFLTALLDIRDILVTAVSAPASVAGTSSNVSNVTNNYNFNNTRSADDGRRTATMLRLFKK